MSDQTSNPMGLSEEALNVLPKDPSIQEGQQTQTQAQQNDQASGGDSQQNPQGQNPEQVDNQQGTVQNKGQSPSGENQGLGNLSIRGEEESIFDNLFTAVADKAGSQNSLGNSVDLSQLSRKFGRTFHSVNDVETFIEGLQAQQEMSSSRMAFSPNLASDIQSAVRNGIITNQELSSGVLSQHSLTPEQLSREMVTQVRENLKAFNKPHSPEDVQAFFDEMTFADQMAIKNVVENQFQQTRNGLISRIQREQESQKNELIQSKKQKAERLERLDRAAQEVASNMTSIQYTSTTITDSQRRDATWATQSIMRMLDYPEFKPFAEAFLYSEDKGNTRKQIENCINRLFYAFNPATISRDIRTASTADTRRQVVQEAQNVQAQETSSLGNGKVQNPNDFGTPDFSRAMDRWTLGE